jgi:hypothetical protein
MATVYFTVELEVDDDTDKESGKVFRQLLELSEELFDNPNVADVIVYQQEA